MADTRPQSRTESLEFTYSSCNTTPTFNIHLAKGNNFKKKIEIKSQIKTRSMTARKPTNQISILNQTKS